MTSVRARLFFVLVSGLFWGCGDDGHGAADAGGEAGVDAGPVDAQAVQVDTGPPAPVCGNARIEPGESCDDGNAEIGDGCTPECGLEPGCGDGVRGPEELCDDGNHTSGDGCRADCNSLESCGNGERDFAVGEDCDDGNSDDGDGCNASCAIEGCGDGNLVPPEACDDGNGARWDGCGTDCRNELVLLARSIEAPEPSVGCDLNADGVPDNEFFRALGGLRPLFNAQTGQSVETGVLLLFLSLYGLDDPVDDPRLHGAILAANDADTDPTNNFTGAGELLVRAAELDPDGLPLWPFDASLTDASLHAGPFDMDLLVIVHPAYPETLRLRNAYFSGQLVPRGEEPTGLEGGMLCGAISINGLAATGNPLRGVEGFARLDGCDGQELTSFADVAVGGTSVLGLTSVPLQPDVDLDRDGLERFEVLRDGPEGCQPVVIACIDGDGSRVEGADCDLDPRFADGYSATMLFELVRAHVVGVAEP